jgi:hypothetical protein
MSAMKIFPFAMVVMGAAAAAVGQAEETAAKPARQTPFLQSGGFVHIPGPNPVITPGPEGAWDGKVVESCAVLKDAGKYFWYYHAQGDSYQIGVATASGPLGPFTRYGDQPVLARGPKGSWDDGDAACAMVLKDGEGRYLMFDHELQAEQKVLRTFDLDGHAPYVKILVENPDPTQNATELSVTARLQG